MKTKISRINFGLMVLIVVFLVTDSFAQITKQHYYNSSSQIKGKVFLDENRNGVFDANDFGLPNQTVSVIDDKFIAVTNQSGDYSMSVEPGFYEIVIRLSGSQKLTTNSNTAKVKTGSSVIEKDFGLTANAKEDDLQINSVSISQPQPGFNNAIELVYKNTGIAKPAGEVNFVMDKNYSLINAKPYPTEVNGNVLTWRFNELNPFKEQRIKIDLHLSTSARTGTLLKSFAKINGSNTDSNTGNNTDTLEQFITGPLLPNSKTVDPSGVIKTFNTVPANVSLVYTIYFQNTTGIPVNDLVIIDSLTSKLSPGTFSLIGSSHTCTVQFSNNTVSFSFLNINLTDSASNSNASRGWVQFVINTANNLFLNDSVQNSADIYFDYNTPVRTTEARIDFVNVSAIEEYNNSQFVKVFPNPFEAVFVIQFEKPCVDCTFELFDLTGKIIHKQLLGSEINYSVTRNNIADGFYVYKIIQNNRIVKIGKLTAN